MCLLQLGTASNLIKEPSLAEKITIWYKISASGVNDSYFLENDVGHITRLLSMANSIGRYFFSFIY